MKTSETLPIYVDSYQFVRELYQITHKFSREYKYCLGEQMNRDVLQLLFYIFQANHIKEERIRYIRLFLAALDMVRVEIRLAHDMQVLSTRQISHLSLFLDKIVKQATAWQKYQVSQDKKEENDKKDGPELNPIETQSV